MGIRSAGSGAIEVAPTVFVEVSGPFKPRGIYGGGKFGTLPRSSRRNGKSYVDAKKAERRRRLLVLERYGNRCVCCGERELTFLTLDHVNNDGSDHRKWLKANSKDLTQWIVDNDFPDTIQVLCYNCNLGRSLNGGVCPHRECSNV